MSIVLWIMVLVAAVSVIVGMSPLGRKGRDKWEAHRGTGKSMLDDFDEERKNIDNLMK